MTSEKDRLGLQSDQDIEHALFPHDPNHDPFGTIPTEDLGPADTLASFRALTIVSALVVEPSTVLLVGEPSSGKSAIAQHIVKKLGGNGLASSGLFTVHEVDCDDSGILPRDLYDAAEALRTFEARNRTESTLVVLDHFDTVLQDSKNVVLNAGRLAFQRSVREVAQRERDEGLHFLFVSSSTPGGNLPKPKPGVQKFVSGAVEEHKIFVVPQLAEDGLIEIHRPVARKNKLTPEEQEKEVVEERRRKLRAEMIAADAATERAVGELSKRFRRLPKED